MAGRWTACLLALAGLAGCRQDMHDSPKHEPFEASTFFADGRAARPQVAGTVARGALDVDPRRTTGRDADGALVATLPVEPTRALFERGRERYDIHCLPCHDRLGYGDGIIVKRGMTRPPSFHVDRLRTAPVGHVFDVITNGFGAMYDLADRIPAGDRWAIAAWVRVLQQSQDARLADVPPAERERLEAAE